MIRTFDVVLGIHHILLIALQYLLTGGLGGVIIVGYATRDLFVTEERPRSEGHRFASDYQELMWLAEKQKRHLNVEETRRFYQLRRQWSDMHAFAGFGATSL